MSIQLSEAAANRIKTHLQSRGSGQGLRLGVKTAGCSGLAYVVDYAEDINRDDRVFKSHGVKVIVNSKDLEYVDGTEIDYKQDGISAVFHFNNPNALLSAVA